MSEASQRYERVASGFDRTLQDVPAEGWTNASPCEEWTARDVAAHVVDTHRRVLATLDGTEPSQLSEDDDVRAEWAAARFGVTARLADPQQATKVVGGMFGEQPWEQLVGRLLCTDTLLHTWDLARATGQDVRLDESAARAALAFLTPLDDAIRRPGGFGPKLDPPAAAGVQAKLLSFAGRRT
jgi:uncharacterized protein (TIGR03086 family)